MSLVILFQKTKQYCKAVALALVGKPVVQEVHKEVIVQEVHWKDCGTGIQELQVLKDVFKQDRWKKGTVLEDLVFNAGQQSVVDYMARQVQAKLQRTELQ